MLFDTDVLVFLQRGNAKAATLVDKAEDRTVSVQTYMELLQEATDKNQHKPILDFLKLFAFGILPLTENIGHRASIYVEEYGLSHHMRAGDALVAATAVENGLTLVTANAKHFRQIKELSLKVLKP